MLANLFKFFSDYLDNMYETRGYLLMKYSNNLHRFVTLVKDRGYACLSCSGGRVAAKHAWPWKIMCQFFCTCRGQSIHGPRVIDSDVIVAVFLAFPEYIGKRILEDMAA
jgi:hypothetical protein